MRKSLVIATLLVLVCSAAAFAGVPDPTRSGCAVSSPTLCQFRFRADGGLDTATLCVTLRDAFDTPVASCTTTADVDLSTATAQACDCKGTQTGVSDGGGVVYFYYSCIGGRGFVDANVTARCSGDIGICSSTIGPFTNPDLNADCAAVAPGGFDIQDIGLFSQGFDPPGYLLYADFDCDTTVPLADIDDIGLFSSGINFGCNDCP